MLLSGSPLVRLAVLACVVGLGLTQLQTQARAAFPHQAAVATAQDQAAVVLIWQGKLLPIVTDVYASLSSLGTAINNRDATGVATVGDQFAGEQQRFESIQSVPSTARGVAKIMDKGLRNLNNGSKALVVGLRAGDSAAEQRAAQQVVQGLRQFQQAVSQIRRMSGPAGEPTPLPSAGGTPMPTPVIKGLP